MSDRTDHTIGKYCAHPSLDEECRRKCILFFSCLLILTPSMYLISGINFWLGRAKEAWPAFAIASVMLLLILTLRKLPSIVIPFRIMALLSLVVLTYQMLNGAGEGYIFIWFYCYPMIVFYVSGHRLGLLWVGLSVLLATWIFFFSPAQELYGSMTSLRFLLTYVIVAAIANRMEYSRANSFKQLMEEKDSLAAAMRQIKTLQGLLPICASCKSIRDDQGYWQRIETYLHDHSEVQLTHGICPDCLQRLYPKEFAAMTRDGRTLPGQHS